MEKKKQSLVGISAMQIEISVLMETLRKDVDSLMSQRMTYVADFASTPSDDEIAYLATLTDLISQLRTAVILGARLEYFQTKIQ